MDTKKSREEKNEISMILQESRKWYDANDVKPEAGECVVIRFENRDKIYGEDENNIMYAEDEKVAQYIRDVDDPKKGRWSICPPYPKYDYSPLSQMDQILDGTVVTHWAKLEEGELEGWKTRFDPIGTYTGLEINVAPEDEEVVYHALIIGANALARLYNMKSDDESNPARPLYAVLNDMQACIDTNMRIMNGVNIPKQHIDEKFIEEVYNSIYLDMVARMVDFDKISATIDALKIINDRMIAKILEPDIPDEGESEDAVEN